ncbi:multidrug and toxin extrusion protein 1 isoform X2 [Phycodurus eques]|uniref:multidrug and toxin extrusion protein 1 isoform X2 n=1 Tax=Phycodurus eques TaxID=693459 RepID=UPI002ACED40D|nr:multidrug and toxin extrusion protein 1 isoform X2 [Phycodurus eques]
MTESSSSSSTSWREASLLSRIRTLLPVGFEGELKNLSLLAVPAILTHFMVLSASFVSTVFCGHLGRVELDAVSLAIAVVNVTGISVGAGLSSACDTLISQTYGAGNLQRVGVIVQRTILILILTCFPCWAVLINTESILLVLGQAPEVARLSHLYVKIFMPALPATFMFQLQAGYLQNQGIIWPQVITGFVANLLNAYMNYIVLFVLNMGVAGSALANIVSQFSMAGILYTYILWKGLHKVTWGGWSKDCLQEWGSFIHLAIPSMLMLCVEWWTFEIAIFLAGLISEVELGAQSVIYQISNCVYMFPFGFSQAGTVRVGNALGAGDAQRAKLSAKLSMFCAGLWTGFCASVSLQSCLLLVYLAKMNWEKVTLEAQIRAGVTRSSEDPQHQSDMYELLVPEEREEEWEEEDEEEEEEEAATVVAVSAPDQYLAQRTLMVHRGLLVALMLFIMVAGIVVNQLLTKSVK